MVCAACAPVPKRTITPVEQAATLPQQQIDPKGKTPPVLKAHLKNGDAVIFSSWTIDTVARRVEGQGRRLDVNRVQRDSGSVTVAIDSVALFETNRIGQHGSVAALAVVTGISAAITVACLSNPKSCFGSCPTFYVGDDTLDVLAEGFSASIAPALEGTDVDALPRVHPTSRHVELHMRDEALETHVVRFVHLLAAPRGSATGRVFRSDAGVFWQSAKQSAPSSCVAANGDCTSLVHAADKHEWMSRTDSTDLGARETIDLTFPRVGGDSLGVVLTYRHTLVSTFVLYQMLGYFGNEAAAFLGRIARGDPNDMQRTTSIADALGAVEVQVKDADGAWQTVGATRETGPLASDAHLVPIAGRGRGTDSIHVRLSLARGSWRIDQVLLASLDRAVVPARLSPLEVRKNGVRSPAALAQLSDSTQQLVALPGDDHTLVFELPSDFKARELFLESRGYYLEWMRNEWIAEQNVARGMAMMAAPQLALKVLAPEFKKREADMERAFWSSKYVRH